MKLKKLTARRAILVLAITIAIFYLLFTKIDFYSVVGILSNANPLYLFLAFLLTLSFPLIETKRWQIILKTMGYNFPYKECFNLTMGAYPLTCITPSKSGDFIKAYYLKDKIPTSKTVGSVLTERIFDVFVLVLYSLIGMLFYKKFEHAGIALIILFCICLIFLFHRLILNFQKKSWNEKLQNLTISLKALMENMRAFSIVIVYSFSIWFLAMLQILIFFNTLEIDIPLLFIFTNSPIAIFIGLLPVTLGGMGTRDAAIIFLFSEYGTPSQLLGVGILFSLFRYWLLALIGLPFMRKMMKLTQPIF